MRKIISLLALTALAALLHPLSAQAQMLVNCAASTACTTAGPSMTGTGDPAWQAFGKLNFNWLNIWNASTPAVAAGTVIGNSTSSSAPPIATSQLVLGSPTGGNEGAGTANTQGLYVNGVPPLLNPSGGVTVGSPTGGAQGSGTLNAQGLYVQGVPPVVPNSAGGISVAGTTQSDSLLTGKNLLPDSAFSADAWNNAIYWLAFYPDTAPYTSGVCGTVGSGTTCYGIAPGTNGSWNANSNILFYIGTGSAAPSNTYAESQVFYLPASSSAYSLALQITANLSSASGGSPYVALFAAAGQRQSLGTEYCRESLTSGTSATYTWTCAGVPGDVGAMMLIINLGGLTATTGADVMFSDPQVEIGTAATAYEKTVGFSSLYSQGGQGPKLWLQLLQMLPQSQDGTLSTSQPAVTLSSTPARVLSTVSSAPALNFGCSASGCEPYPAGLISTFTKRLSALAQIACTGVTTAGTVTVTVVNKAVSNGENWNPLAGTDGVTSDIQNVPVNAGTSYFYLPLQASVSGANTPADVGAFDMQASVSSALAPAGACEVTSAQMHLSVQPTDSTIAGWPYALTYGDRSHLVY